MNEHDTSQWEERLLARAARLEQSLLESFLVDEERYVDPTEPYWDDGNGYWPAAGANAGFAGAAVPAYNERFLSELRNQCRNLALGNEFAINALENRINYMIGLGHQYHAIPQSEADLQLAESVRESIEEFVEVNHWQKRHKEIVRRCDRDGEAFLRLFPDPQGPLRIRFVEPDQITTPQNLAASPEHSFGIHTDPNDVENVLGYWIDGQYVEGSEIQHRKGNVDSNVKRGMPLFYPVRKNLRRVEKLLRNMSAVAEIQSAIALIRKHVGVGGEAIRKFVQNQAEGTTGQPGSSRTVQRFAPGTILDAYGGVDYQFPIAAIDASRYIQILQAELRAIASRLVIPEFMLSSDASNANYSSTMVAEGPSVRMFERLQYELIADDLVLLRKNIEHAIRRGRLPGDTLSRVRLHAIPPMLAVRDRLKEARADEILLKCGVLSPQTMSMRYGLDPGKESQMRCHCKDTEPV